MARKQSTTGSGLSDDELAKLRAAAAERVAGFPPLTREQAETVRSILQLKHEPAREDRTPTSEADNQTS